MEKITSNLAKWHKNNTKGLWQVSSHRIKQMLSNHFQKCIQMGTHYTNIHLYHIYVCIYNSRSAKTPIYIFSFLSCTYTTEEKGRKKKSIFSNHNPNKVNLWLWASTYTHTALNCTLIIWLNLMLMAGVNAVPFSLSIPPCT